MKYKVYLNELDDKSNELINYSKNNIASKIDELSMVITDIDWYGNAGNKYKLGYDKKIIKLKKYGENIEKLGKYLAESHNSYKESNDDLERSWNDFLDELKGDNNDV